MILNSYLNNKLLKSMNLQSGVGVENFSELRHYGWKTRKMIKMCWHTEYAQKLL